MSTKTYHTTFNKSVLRSSIIFMLILIILVSGCEDQPSSNIAQQGTSNLGVAFTPANLPDPSDQDILDFFERSKEIGNQVILIVEWNAMPPLQDIRNIQTMTRQNGMEFNLQLSPISLYDGRKSPAIPATVNGNSFGDNAVREAFKAQVLELAALEPDYLGIGTEVNLLAQNPAEFKAYVSMTKDTYAAVKTHYPSQDVTVSFQWDILLTQKQFDILPHFQDSLDIYSFTSYPMFFQDPGRLPAEYYSSIRELLPTQRIAFSEIGWSSAGSEDTQAQFYARLPGLMTGVNPEYVDFALLHDVSVFTGDLASLNSVGVRNRDGTPKKSWDVVKDMDHL